MKFSVFYVSSVTVQFYKTLMTRAALNGILIFMFENVFYVRYVSH